MKKRIRGQRRIPGLTRVPSNAALLPVLRRRVEKEAARFGVSKSFVIAVALAHTFGVDHEEFPND